MPANDKPWCVYLLLCRGNSVYTGITPDLEKRFKTHATGRGATYTKLNPPERILGQVWLVSKREAAVLEYQVKQLSAPAKRDWLEKVPPSGPDNPVALSTVNPGAIR